MRKAAFVLALFVLAIGISGAQTVVNWVQIGLALSADFQVAPAANGQMVLQIRQPDDLRAKPAGGASWALPRAPRAIVGVYWNGLKYTQGLDYDLSGSTITWKAPHQPSTDAVVTVICW